ncbi:aminotransferase class I/II-fold pyridoxal phosphate-dependent enzyme, partial [Candidatus Bipolaricaulota bacterium]|nr:aminotransferase class I/II-fold pyridoxal phosphate-dependent enzyme [Candidatus Bipolaricaulota bacterium]
MSESVLAKNAAQRVGRAPLGDRETLLELAQGKKDLIKLGRGDPDLDTPSVIIEAAVDALRNGYTHYTHWAGLAELREAIAEKLERDNGLHYDPSSEIVVTTGGQEGMNVIFQGLLNEGDEVLIADPYYTAYKNVINLAGGVLRTIPTEGKDDFALEPEQLEAAITDKTK